jgi:signal transduction histidine kinase/ActR/RegA family two-component response regulator
VFEIHPEMLGTLLALGALGFIVTRQVLIASFQREHTHLPWIAITLCGIAFTVARVVQLRQLDASVALTTIRIQFGVTLLLPGLAIATADVICERPVSRTAWWSIIGAIPLMIVCIATPWLIDGPMQLHRDWFGHEHYGARTKSMVVVVVPMSIGVIVAMRRRVRSMPSSLAGLRRNLRVGVAIFIVVGLHDAAMGAGLFRSVFLFEYAFVAFGLIAANFEVRRTAILRGELEGLVAIKREEYATQTATLGIAERRLERSRLRYRYLTDATGEGVVLCDGYRVLDANRAACEMLARTEPQLLGVDLRELTSDVDKSLLDPLLAAEPGPVEITLRRLDGKPLAASLKATPIPEGSAGTRVLLIRDISGERDLQTRLALADRLAAIGTLAAGTAHEINNPLTFVLANAEMLGEELERARDSLDPTVLQSCKELVGEVRTGADRIGRIVKDLMTLARERRGDEAAIDIGHTLERCIAMANNELRHRATVVRELAATQRVLASEGRIFQVFLNLIVNASQAIPEGHVDDNQIRIATRDEGSEVVVEISDTGVGIDKAVMGKIFTPFFTTKEVGRGTGLGLSISQGIVANLGGTIGVESEPGKGTTFRIRLPAMQAAVTSDEPIAATTATPRLRVLLVDDEVRVANGLARALAAHHVELAYSGRAALEQIEAHDFDVVLCDLMMPDVTGMELYSKLVAAGNKITDRFLFITGGVFSEQARAFLEQIGESRWLSKPISMAELRKRVSAAGQSRSA